MGVIDCVTESRSKWFDGPGYFGYVLANPRPLKKPIHCKGNRGFWTVPPEILRRCKV